MAYRVLVGGISPEGEHMIRTYLDRFMPDTELEPLKAMGIKGRMKNHAPRQDVLFCILDGTLWDACVGYVDNVLALDKVHKYETDEGLGEFLVKTFGPLDGGSGTGTVPPDQLIGADVPEDDFIPKTADFSKESSTGATVPPDQIQSVVMVDEDLPTAEESEEVAATDSSAEVIEKLNIQIRDLQSKLAGKESLVRSLTLQLNDKAESDQDDIKELVGRIRELETELEAKNALLDGSDEAQRINNGKVQHAEEVLEEFEELRKQLKQATDERSKAESERDSLKKRIDTLNGEIEGLREQVSQADGLRADLDARIKRIGELEQELAVKSSMVTDLESGMSDHQGVVTEAAQLRSEIEVLQQQIDSDKEKLKSLGEARDEAVSKLSAKQLEADNLQTDINTLNEKLESQTETITQLRADLQSKVSELEETQKSLLACREELRAAREELSQKAADLAASEKARSEAVTEASSSSEYSQSLVESTQKLSTRITELTEELNEKSQKLEAVLAKLQEAESLVTSLSQQLDDTTSELNESNTALSDKRVECAELSKQLTASQEEVAAKSTEIVELQNQLQSAKEAATKQAGMLGQQVSDKDTEIAELRKQLRESQTDAEAKAEELESLSKTMQEQVAESSLSLGDVQGQLQLKNTEIEDLRGRLSTKDGTIQSLTNDIQSLHEQLAAKDGEITQINEQLLAVKQQLLGAQAAGSEAQVSADTQKQAFEKVLADKKALEDKLVDAETKRMELDTRIKTLEADLQQERSRRGSLGDSNMELTAQNEKLNNRIKQLEESFVRAKAEESMSEQLSEELLESRRKVARLESELSVLKSTSEADKASDLRIEIVRLRNELATLHETTVPMSEADTLRRELQQSREHAASLELAIVEKDSQVARVSSSVFAQLQNIAIPKGAYDFRFQQLSGMYDKFVCMVSGSEESTTNVYQVLRSACTAARKRVLIVDIVTDSSIDREFGIKRVVSPIEWLDGKAHFKQFLSPTRFTHVQVLSTALAYINDLFLMNVDWESRFAELNDFSADTVVLYVGCLNNLVTKVLFDMFSQVMKSYVICKATPANLRTTILNLTGFPNLSPTVTVECVNFSDTASAGMYQRLVAKYKAQVLRDNEVLPL